MRSKPGVLALTFVALLALIFSLPGCWLGGKRGDDPDPIPESEITTALMELIHQFQPIACPISIQRLIFLVAH